MGTDGFPSSASLRWRQKTIWTRARSARGTVKEKKENAEVQGMGCSQGALNVVQNWGAAEWGKAVMLGNKQRRCDFFLKRRASVEG